MSACARFDAAVLREMSARQGALKAPMLGDDVTRLLRPIDIPAWVRPGYGLEVLERLHRAGKIVRLESDCLGKYSHQLPLKKWRLESEHHGWLAVEEGAGS